MAETEDIPYEISDHVVADEDKNTDGEDQVVDKVLVKEIHTYLDEAVAEHNSLDLIDLTEQAKMTPAQQIAVHKLMVNHLRNLKAVIDNIIKERV